PEYDFEHELVHVAAFARRHALRCPIVLDNERQIWRAYANRYWPHTYVIDARGVIRYDHEGEGAYAETEAIIRALLLETRPGVQLPAYNPAEEADGPGICLPATPELACGYFRGALGNSEGCLKDEPALYLAPRVYDSG